MLTVAFTPLIELRVSPVVRPLFFTARFTLGARVALEIVPISRISPVALT